MYYAGIAALRFSTRVLGLVNGKAARRVAGAREALHALSPTPPGRDCYWMHCASVGEFEQGRPVWQALQALRPRARFVLTFFSPSGVEWFADQAHLGEVAYLPWDVRGEAGAFVDRLSPKLALFVKYEWWLGVHAALRERGVPTVAFSVAFRQNQAFFRRWHPLHAGHRELIEGLSALFVQSQSSAELIETHGYRQRARFVGDTRLDRVREVAREKFVDRGLERWLRGRERVIVAGSTWPADEALLRELLRQREDYVLVCAPHEVTAASRARLLGGFEGFAPQAYSSVGSVDIDVSSRVMVLDAKGVLAKAYRYGRLAYVGGGFGDGVHNTLEPVAYGLPVAFGPRYERFDEAIALVEAGVAFPCRRGKDLKTFVAGLDDTAAYLAAREAARSYVEDHGSATAAILDYIIGHHLA